MKKLIILLSTLSFAAIINCAPTTVEPAINNKYYIANLSSHRINVTAIKRVTQDSTTSLLVQIPTHDTGNIGNTWSIGHVPPSGVFNKILIIKLDIADTSYLPDTLMPIIDSLWTRIDTIKIQDSSAIRWYYSYQ
jgi:hypothetical protein